MLAEVQAEVGKLSGGGFDFERGELRVGLRDRRQHSVPQEDS